VRLRSCTPYPRRLAIEPSRLDLRVHREGMCMLPDGPLLEHSEHLLEQSCRFSLSRVNSPKGRCRRCECADLQSHLGVTMVSTVHLRNLNAPRTCHRARMLRILAFDAIIFSRRSPDFHSCLKPGSFFLPRFGLIAFNHSSISRMILRLIRPVCEQEARLRVLCQLL